jgi:hypothetical protein
MLFFCIYKNFLNSISEITFDERCHELKKINKRYITLYIFRTHDIIKKFIFIQLLIFNFFSIFFFFSFFNNLKFEQKLKIKNFITKFKILKSDIIYEIVHAIIILKNDNSEKINREKKNILNVSYDNFYENIVIGSGPGGSVTALELIKKNKTTLLIEKGNFWKPGEIKHSSEEFYNKWKYGGFTAALGNNIIQYSSGECFGGGSEINSGLCHLIDESFINGKRTDKENLLTSHDVEKLLDFNPENLSPYLNNLSNNLIVGAKKLGWVIKKIPRFQSIINKSKNSMTNTLLKEYLSLNGKISLLTDVIKIKKVSHKEYKIISKIKNRIVIFSCKNIFVCCGAPYSFNLLKSSNLIKKNNMDNFHFHPMLKIIAVFNNEVNSKKVNDIIPDQITNFYPNYIFGHATSTLPFLKISAYQNKNAYNDVCNNFKKMTIMHSTFSFGTGEITNIPFLKNFIIKYKFDADGYKLITEGLKNLLKFVFNSGAVYVYVLDDKITKITKEDFDNNTWLINSKKIKLSSVHMLGGFNINGSSIIDKYGKIINHNIYVNDSSLISKKLLKNPQGAIMTIAKRNIKQNLSQI